MLRPWALIAPILVLLIATPMIRPLRAPMGASDRQKAVLESVRNLVTHGTLQLDPARVKGLSGTVAVGDRLYSQDPPMFCVYLGAIAWILERCGVTFAKDAHAMEFFLTLFGVTVPVAMASGLTYRMSRVFELRRWWRVILAVTCVLGTGWLSYSVVLLPHALAAAALMAGAACIITVAQARQPQMAVAWIFLCGFCTSFAAAVDPGALWILLLLPAVILTLKLPLRTRIICVLLYIAGAAPALTLHASINTQITGDILPPRWHMQIARSGDAVPALQSVPLDDNETFDTPTWLAIGRGVSRMVLFTLGAHGIFSHFPILVLGLAGVLLVMHRHWARWTKFLAAITLLGMLGHLILKSCLKTDLVDNAFSAARWVAFMPMLMFWAGAFLRRQHGIWMWLLTSLLLALSVTIAVLGMTNPDPADGYTRFTATEAVDRIVWQNSHANNATTMRP